MFYLLSIKTKNLKILIFKILKNKIQINLFEISDFQNFSENLAEMTKYIIDEKGSEVISEIHDKDFKAKKAEEDKKSDSSDESSGKFTDVSFEDI